jgi:hypothetical protein
MKTETLNQLFQMRDKAQYNLSNYDGIWEEIRDYIPLKPGAKYRIRDKIQYLYKAQRYVFNDVTKIITTECGESCDDQDAEATLELSTVEV